MKKLLTLSVSALMALCASADPITKAKALQLAQEYLVPGHTMSLVAEAKPRKVAAVNDNAPYYIISRGENQGFVIVAGDDCLPEILGYTEQGDFDASDLPPALQDMLDCWQMAVESAQADGSNVTIAAARKMETRAANNRVNIAPFVTAHWHQSSPYNDICPVITADGNPSKGKKAMTGCVATAASQILYYWRRDLPSTLQSTTPTYGYGDAPVTRSVPKGTPMKWDLMLDQYGSESQEYKQTVAEFVFAVGAATWLTYGFGGGEATAGHIEDIPHTFSAYFGMNGGTVHYRENYSQEGWTQLIYDELAKEHPVMYTGVHPNNGGHAVFVHGYRASDDKFYFNFGWGAGNGYDGYYTTTLTDGMNGFNGSQSALIGAYPKSWNITADIIPPAHVYANVENEFTVKVKNNSTLSLSGVYLFTSASNTRPSKLSNADSSDKETVIAVDDSGEITLKAKPKGDKISYIFITDANLNVLAKTSVELESVDSDLRLVDVYTDASTDTETFMDKKYQVVYNSQSNAYATIANATNYTYDGVMVMEFSKYNDAKSEWESVGSKTATLSLTPQGTGTAQFNIVSTSLCSFEVGKYYIGKLANPVPSTKDPISYAGANDTIVRFILREGDMSVVGFDEKGCLALKGHFDVTMFNTTAFAKKSAYKTATSYDLTQCVGVKNVYQTINPNALYYVADNSEATGTNIIKGGKCENLSLTPGYSFVPSAPFEAAKAEITIGAEAGKWYIITVPFAAIVPDGVVAREITSHNAAGISGKTNDMKTLEAGKSYLVMSSYSGNVTLSGTNVKVVQSPVANADPALVGTFVATKTPAGSQLLNNDETQYFEPVSEGSDVEALRGYWNAADAAKKFRTNSETYDLSFINFAKEIEQAYQTLNRFKYVASSSANNACLAAIKQAEKEFSNREGATTAIVNECIKQLQEAEEAYLKKVNTVRNVEIDFTGNIENPSFESNSTKGWTLGTKDGYTSVGKVYNGTQANGYRAVGLDGKYVFQSLIAEADSSSVSISQTVEGLTPGYYRLTAKLGTDENSTVTMFAGDSTVTVSGHAFGHLYLTEAVIDSILVDAPEGAETGSLTIGVREGRWYKADDFVLTCIRSFIVDDEADGIADIFTEAAECPKGIYTLQGVKVATITAPGIYIVDGKKVFVGR